MVDKIYKIKNKYLELMEQELDMRGAEHTDVSKMDMYANIVHHLAEAEDSCWQAEYYRNTVEQMKKNSAGYGGGTGSSAGYGNMTERMGYNTPSGYSQGRSGFMDNKGSEDVVESLRKQIQSASPDERERLRHQAMTVLGTI